MRRFLKGLSGVCAGLVLGAVLALGAVGPAKACELRVGWQVWAPYQMPGDSGPKGLDIALIRTVAERAGCAVAFQQVPWTRLLQDVESGDMDVALAAARNAEREGYAHFTEPYRFERVGVMVRRDDQAIQALDSLKEMIDAGRTIGLWRDYHYGETVAKLRADPAYADGFKVIHEGRTLVRMLAAGRVDATLGDPVADVYTARQLGVADKVKPHGLTVLKTPVHFMLSQESVPASARTRLNEAIAALRADGTLEALVRDYVGS